LSGVLSGNINQENLELRLIKYYLKNTYKFYNDEENDICSNNCRTGHLMYHYCFEWLKKKKKNIEIHVVSLEGGRFTDDFKK
jgi:hypothetical protein